MEDRASDTTAAIVVAGGRGTRFGGAPPKTLAMLAGRPVLAWALAAFRDRVDTVVVVAPAGLEAAMTEVARTVVPDARVVTGGVRRQDSVEAGLDALDDACRWVLVHDAARPLVDGETVEAVLAAARESGAAVPVVPVHSTVKAVNEAGWVERTVPRDGLRLVQTPQGVRRELLERALAAAGEQGVSATDEAGLLERLGVKVRAVPGRPGNLKITTPEDLAFARAWLAARGGES